MSGTLYGLGIGPGDPELLTLKAHRILQHAPVIAYPAANDTDSLARSIAAAHIPAGRIEIVMRMPMIAAARQPAEQAYDGFAAEIREHLSQDRDVAVLCLGDPFFYGTFMYLYARLAADHAIEIVPGVTAVAAATSLLGLPLAARDDIFTVLPATLPAEELARRLGETDAAAILKVGRHLSKVRKVLDQLGLTDAARYAERVGMAGQRVMPLSEMDDRAPYFSMILVHARGDAA